MKKTAAIVLAAGKGKRMNSDLPKVLHPLAGRPIIDHVLDSLEPMGIDLTVVIVGHGADQVTDAVAPRGVKTVLQAEQLGTGHAVMVAEPALADFTGTVLTLTADVPLLATATMKAFLAYHEDEEAACTVMTTMLADPTGYGRIVRAADETVQAIVEHKDADEAQLKIHEINTGILAFDSNLLFDHIDELSQSNAQGEYYLTDMVGIFRRHTYKVAGFVVENNAEVRGINSPEQLEELERIYLRMDPSRIERR